MAWGSPDRMKDAEKSRREEEARARREREQRERQRAAALDWQKMEEAQAPDYVPPSEELAGLSEKVQQQYQDRIEKPPVYSGADFKFDPNYRSPDQAAMDRQNEIDEENERARLLQMAHRGATDPGSGQVGGDTIIPKPPKASFVETIIPIGLEALVQMGSVVPILNRLLPEKSILEKAEMADMFQPSKDLYLEFRPVGLAEHDHWMGNLVGFAGALALEPGPGSEAAAAARLTRRLQQELGPLAVEGLEKLAELTARDAAGFIHKAKVDDLFKMFGGEANFIKYYEVLGKKANPIIAGEAASTLSKTESILLKNGNKVVADVLQGKTSQVVASEAAQQSARITRDVAQETIDLLDQQVVDKLAAGGVTVDDMMVNTIKQEIISVKASPGEIARILVRRGMSHEDAGRLAREYVENFRLADELATGAVRTMGGPELLALAEKSGVPADILNTGNYKAIQQWLIAAGVLAATGAVIGMDDTEDIDLPLSEDWGDIVYPGIPGSEDDEPSSIYDERELVTEKTATEQLEQIAVQDAISARQEAGYDSTTAININKKYKVWKERADGTFVEIPTKLTDLSEYFEEVDNLQGSTMTFVKDEESAAYLNELFKNDPSWIASTLTAEGYNEIVEPILDAPIWAEDVVSPPYDEGYGDIDRDPSERGPVTLDDMRILGLLPESAVFPYPEPPSLNLSSVGPLLDEEGEPLRGFDEETGIPIIDTPPPAEAYEGAEYKDSFVDEETGELYEGLDPDNLPVGEYDIPVFTLDDPESGEARDFSVQDVWLMRLELADELDDDTWIDYDAKTNQEVVSAFAPEGVADAEEVANPYGEVVDIPEQTYNPDLLEGRWDEVQNMAFIIREEAGLGRAGAMAKHGWGEDVFDVALEYLSWYAPDFGQTADEFIRAQQAAGWDWYNGSGGGVAMPPSDVVTTETRDQTTADLPGDGGAENPGYSFDDSGNPVDATNTYALYGEGLENSENVYGITNQPPWWQSYVPAKQGPLADYLAVLNSVMPYLAPQDAMAVGGNLYRNAPKEFSAYSAANLNLPITQDLDIGLMMNKSWVENMIISMDNLRNAQGYDAGPGYTWMHDFLNTIMRYLPVEGSRQRRADYEGMLGAIEPMLSSASSQTETAAYVSLARMIYYPTSIGNKGRIVPTVYSEGDPAYA